MLVLVMHNHVGDSSASGTPTGDVVVSVLIATRSQMVYLSDLTLLHYIPHTATTRAEVTRQFDFT